MTTATQYLSIYLNDHLAGSVAAVELLERIKTSYGANVAATVVATLMAEVKEDQRDLESLISALGITRSASRQAVGWLSERLMAVKFTIDDVSEGKLRLLESIEVVAIGIHGKLALWEALAAAAAENTALAHLDYARLVSRAKAQRNTAELLRLNAAVAAFTA